MPKIIVKGLDSRDLSNLRESGLMIKTIQANQLRTPERLREESESLTRFGTEGTEARLMRAAADEIERLRAIVEQCSEALNVVAVGIWRDKRSNTCGLIGASAAVHVVEFARKALRAAEAAKEK